MDANESFDILIIGAGMSGLIAACQLGQVGKRVLLVENLGFLGGRFSAFQYHGAEIPSGAFHTFPHGRRGPFAQALRRCGVEVHIAEPHVFASFHVDGRHIVAKTFFDVLKVVPTWAEKLMLVRALFHSWIKLDYPASFGQWLIDIGMSERGRCLYDRFCQFALSASVYDIPYAEGRRVTEMILNYGVPGVPIGGAREVNRQLGLAALNAGVDIRKNTQAHALLVQNGRVAGAALLDRRKNMPYEVKAPIVISTIGPAATYEMARQAGLIDHTGFLLPLPPPATGLKIQVLSPKSLVDHDGIMFCLDTQRVAGILQATNADPSLAPDGRHLLISHQTIPQGADWQAEKALALEDWRYLFGKDFEDCEVLGVSQFPASFPVNWAVQGYDVRQQVFAEYGLWMAGDGLKPSGLMMVEGVGASAELVVKQILRNG